MTKRKITLLCITLLLAGMVACCSIYVYAGISAGSIAPVYDAMLSTGPMKRSSVSSAESGKCFCLSFAGVLREETYKSSTLVATAVDDMLSAGQGVAYRRNSDLYYWEDNDVQLIAENVLYYAWTKNGILYFADGILYCDGIYITELPEKTETLCGLLATQQCIVFWTHNHVYSYTQANGIAELSVGFGSDSAFFLYDEWLIATGENASGLQAYSIFDRTVYDIDLEFATTEAFNEISVASNGTQLYFSIQSKSWPKLKDETHCGTYQIDLETWRCVRLEDGFHPALICSMDGLYELKDFSIRVQRIVLPI